MDIMKINKIENGRVYMMDGTIQRAALPEMVNIVQQSRAVRSGLTVAISALDELYNIKRETADRKRDIVLSVGTIHANEIQMRNYIECVSVLDGVSQSITNLRIVFQHASSVELQAAKWLNENGVII